MRNMEDLNQKNETTIYSINVMGIPLSVEFKDIQNIHLSVFPPDGRVHVSAPLKYDMSLVKFYALSKFNWIQKQIDIFKNQEREPNHEFLNLESHFFFGERYLLQRIHSDRKKYINLNHNILEVYLPNSLGADEVSDLIFKFYRKELKKQIPKFIYKWESILKIKVESFGIKRMKTKWGSSLPAKRTIWINLELAKKPIRCLDYVVLHEMVHFIEKTHNQKFVHLMDTHLPKWKFIRDELNSLPI